MASIDRPEIRRFADLAAQIRRGPARCGPVRLVAIDGSGGAGKSTFAVRLARHLGDAPVLHTDDFASWDNPIDWWDRLETDALQPLGRGEPAWFAAYDWLTRRRESWREVRPAAVVLLEGVSAARQAVADRLTLAVWVETTWADRLERGLQRDGEAMRMQWEAWKASEDTHFAIDRTRERANLVVDGAPTHAHDPEQEFVAIG